METFCHEFRQLTETYVSSKSETMLWQSEAGKEIRHGCCRYLQKISVAASENSFPHRVWSQDGFMMLTEWLHAGVASILYADVGEPCLHGFMKMKHRLTFLRDGK